MEKPEKPCPFESRRVRCGRCGGPYNLDTGSNLPSIPPKELPKYGIVFSPNDPKILGGVPGGRCDECGFTIGVLLREK